MKKILFWYIIRIYSDGRELSNIFNGLVGQVLGYGSSEPSSILDDMTT
jgi:hypothetical protein